jgi:hypothetical protein
MKKTLLFLLLLVHSLLFAQEASVAFKTNTFSYKYNKALKIKMNCEMAEIIISKSSGNTVEIKCTYSARHTEKTTATKELDRHHILVSKTLNDIYVSNYFTLLQGENEPKAKLKVKFEILVPEMIKIDIKNNFGSFAINGISVKGNVEQSFGKVDLEKIVGDLILKCELSDVKLNAFAGKLELRNKSGDVTINNFDGQSLLIENSNATIEINGISNSVNTKLVLNNCKLNAKGVDYQKHSININSYKEFINNNENFNIEKKGDYYNFIQSNTFPSFNIKSVFTKINLN